MTTRVISWRTTKQPNGQFRFCVYSFGYQVPAEILKVGVLASRDRATRQARKWCRYFKGLQVRSALGLAA